jgi:hypothetical protein
MNDFIKNLVNYVIEAKIKDYRGDQSAETYRLSRINREISPSDAPADKGSKFAKINADYKEEKRLERAPRGPQTRPVVKKPVEEGYRELKDIAQKFGGEVVQTGRDVKDAIVGGQRLPKKPEIKPTGPSSRPKLQPADSALTYQQKLKKYGYKEVPVEEGYRELKDIAQKFGGEVVQTGRDVKDAIVGGKRLPKEPASSTSNQRTVDQINRETLATRQRIDRTRAETQKLRQERLRRENDPSGSGESLNLDDYADPKDNQRVMSNRSTATKKRTPHSSEDSNNKYHIGPPIKEGIVDAASRGIEAVDNALGNPLTRGIRKQGEKDRAKLKDMMDNKGAKGKITREPANPFSKGDWQSRKERMDKAIDG